MDFHPYSNIFPKLDEKELRELADDIQIHGLREKIWTYNKQILDGRNRFNACVLAGVKAEFRAFKGTDEEALALVVSNNITRRHLTVPQRAMAAAQVATLKKGERKDAPDAPRGASAQAEAAEQFGVSRNSVQRARQVVEHGSKRLQDAVQSGDVPLSRAATVVDLPKAQQLAAAQAPSVPDAPPDALSGTELAAEAEREHQEYQARIDRVMAADDKLAAANAEIKRLNAELVAAFQARDRYMNESAEKGRQLKKLESQVKRLRDENEKLKERVAIATEK